METGDHPELLARERQIAEWEAGRRRPTPLRPADPPAGTATNPGGTRAPETAHRVQSSPLVADLAGTGRRLWAELHRRPLVYTGDAATERAWLARFAARVPCGTCRESWAAIVAERPPDLSDAVAYARFGWEAHNRVNAKMGKPIVRFEDAAALWGW